MTDISSKTYYELLGVTPDATVEQIKESYREIARIYHPDSNFYSDIISDAVSDEGSDVFKEITAAYNTLIDNNKRREYDETVLTNLDTWDSSFDSYAQEGPQPEQRDEAPRRKTQDIPEEWIKEREHFEQHYAEILRPAPKVNLVGEDEDKPFTDWEEELNAGTRFGSVASDSELDSIPVIPQMRRPASRQRRGLNFKDPFILMLFGIPVLIILVLVEVLVFL